MIRGDAGIGKTALLEFAAQNAAGMTVLKIAGTAAEADLPFAALLGVVRPILDTLEQLVEPQRRALAGALGLAEAQSPDRFLISAAALSLLAAAAEENPILCLIDDAQWLDQPSAEALVFASRRLRADAVAVLFAASEWEGRRFDASGVPELMLAGVDGESAEKILGQAAQELAPSVRARLVADAGGNPLALRELPSTLSDDELSGRVELPEQLPLTPRLRRVFDRRIRRLPDNTCEALLVCALEGVGDASVVLRACADLGLSAEALAPAETLRLVRTGGGRIAFAHPLVRAAIVEASALAQRQRVHSALADSLSADEHVDRRVWHQAMATLTGDEEVASALEASARRAQERAGYASAASAFQRAAELTRDESRLPSRLASAADAAWSAGQIERAYALIERALHFASGDTQSHLLHLRGTIELAQGRHADAVSTLLAAARESGDPSTTLAILVDVGEPALKSGFPDEFAIQAGKQAAALPAVTSRDAFNRSVLLWRQRRFERKFDESWPFYEEALRHAANLADDPEVHYQAGEVTMMTCGPGAGLSFFSQAVELARRQGRIGLLPTYLAMQSFEMCSNSEFERAYASAGEGLRLALDTRQSPTLHLIGLARVEAVWGDANAARAHLEEAQGHEADNYLLVATIGCVLGLLELGLGSADAAADVMLRASPGDRLSVMWTAAVPDLVEAIVRTRHPAATDIGPQLARLRRPARTSRAFGSLLARCEALLGLRPPGQAFVDALELADVLSPFERARTELLYGEWLRRERRRKESRPHLRAAVDEFRRLGARPWQDRAEAELRASGETARKREPSTIRDLTPQELQIAQLAAEGHSNPEIAAQLYLSPRTIEYHLRKVFSKLGIASRSELIRGVATLDGAPSD